MPALKKDLGIEPALLRCLAPIEDVHARILILGSMPGTASLAAGQYYAHPRNLFWHFAGTLLNFDPQAPYEYRVDALKAAGIALWDVCASCRRKGSLDAHIEALAANDFGDFFNHHPNLRQVFFNGAKACATYSLHVRHSFALEYQRLPSTSPANASIPYPKKLEAWQAIALQLKTLDEAVPHIG